MEKKITKEMVNALNANLTAFGCGFEYYIEDDIVDVPCIRRRVKDPTNKFVDSDIINCTKEFYEWLDNFFKTNYDIELSYNNTGNICWAK